MARAELFPKPLAMMDLTDLRFILASTRPNWLCYPMGERSWCILEPMENFIMAQIRFPTSRRAARWFLAMVAGVLSASLAFAQSPAKSPKGTDNAPPSIDAEVRQIETLSRSDPGKALDRLQALLTRLDTESGLTNERRDTLKRMVRDRIRVTTAEIETPPAEKAVVAARRLTDKERRDAEADSTGRLFETVKKLQREGKLGAARAATSRLPDNPAAMALRRTTDVADQLEENRNLQRERTRGPTDALRGVERAALIPKGDVEYPRDWRARTKDRKHASAVPMTAREKAILQALDTPISVNFKDSPLETVLEYLRTITGQPIAVDPAALQAAGVTYETLVSLRLKDVSLRFVLRKLLGELGLAYIVKNEVIQVLTAEQARNTLVTRVHYIGDLVTAPDEFTATLQAAQLIDLIETTLEPSSWRRNGGPGTIVYNHLSRSLVIKQTAEFHGTLVNGLP